MSPWPPEDWGVPCPLGSTGTWGGPHHPMGTGGPHIPIAPWRSGGPTSPSIHGDQGAPVAPTGPGAPPSSLTCGDRGLPCPHHPMGTGGSRRCWCRWRGGGSHRSAPAPGVKPPAYLWIRPAASSPERACSRLHRDFKKVKIRNRLW